MKFAQLLCSIAMSSLAMSIPAHAAEKVIAAIVFQQDQFFRIVQSGMEAAAKKGGVVLLQANSDSKPEKEQSLVNTYISRKVDAIVIAPLSKTASASSLKRARDAGIHVVTYNSTIEGDTPEAFVNSSQEELGASTGKAAAAFIKAKLGGKAKIAILQFKSLVPEQSAARVGGFTKAAAAGGAVEIVADQDAWLAEKAVSVTNDILTAHPDVNVIFAANEGGTVGAVQAVRNSARQGKVFVFGIDGSQQLINFLQSDDDILQAVTAQQPYQIGYSAFEAALAAIDGKTGDKEIVVPGKALNRNDPQGVKAFGDYLKSYK